jgi:hypothetical protein
MARILIKCPRTEHYIFTGIEMPADLLHFLPEPQKPVFCPHCRIDHAWRRLDATPIEPRRWSEVPRVEDCLLRADANAAAANRATTLRQRALCHWMELTWLRLAKDFEYLASLDRRHRLNGRPGPGSSSS